MTVVAEKQVIRSRLLGEDGRPLKGLPKYEDGWLRAIMVHLLRVRCMDERMLKLQRAGRVGFVGSMLGMEAAMIGTAAALAPDDWLWSGLREGGAALMRGLPLDEYLAQMFCNSNDTAKGRQMCNHLQHAGSNYPSWSSVIGTQIPHGVGAAFAAKRRGSDEVHGIYFGDGATSSSGFQSGLNFAGVWKVAAVFVCMDNGWAISVPASEQSAQTEYAKKGVAYGVPGHFVDGNDVLACHEGMQALVKRARAGGGPSLLHVQTYRMLGHSSADDPTKYRDAGEVEAWEKRDPIRRYERFLVGRGVLKKDERQEIETELLGEIDAVIHEQEAAPPMPHRSLVEDVYAEVPRHLRVQYNDFVRIAARFGDAQPGQGAFPL